MLLKQTFDPHVKMGYYSNENLRGETVETCISARDEWTATESFCVTELISVSHLQQNCEIHLKGVASTHPAHSPAHSPHPLPYYYIVRPSVKLEKNI